MLKDITGKKFGRLTVIGRAGYDKHGAIWKCICDCGRVKEISFRHIANGNTKSCGCLRKELDQIRNKGADNPSYKHGGSHSRLYVIWSNMKQRCLNPNATEYSAYGGRGITVCSEWLHDFKLFQGWALSHGYQDDLTIDRIDNDKGYSPDNCRWATKEQQYGNTQRAKQRKAPCISTDQSEIQEAANDHGGLVHPVYHGPLQKTRRNFQ